MPSAHLPLDLRTSDGSRRDVPFVADSMGGKLGAQEMMCG